MCVLECALAYGCTRVVARACVCVCGFVRLCDIVVGCIQWGLIASGCGCVVGCC